MAEANVESMETTGPESAQVEAPETPESSEDQLLGLPVEKLAAMVREKRKAEASVRAKLRDAEAERDRLSGAVSGYQRRAFAEAAKGAQMQESALDDVLAVVDLEAVLGEDGTVDAAKAQKALGELRKSKPHYFKAVPMRSGGDITGGGYAVRPSSQWADVLG